MMNIFMCVCRRPCGELMVVYTFHFTVTLYVARFTKTTAKQKTKGDKPRQFDFAVFV